jgi:hypothetical protein
MKKRTLIWWSTSALVGACLVGLGLVLAQAEPPKVDSTPSQTNSMTLKTNVTEVEKPVLKPQLTAAQWKTLMLHMQVRANIPPSQCKLILQYLQDNSGR